MFKKSEYVISAVTKKQYPNKNNENEFVFLGRSNVGKSSFINALVGRKMLARTSSKPGKTQTLNFYHIDDSFYFVDVPGYGYASRSKSDREDYGNYIEEYLTANENLKIAFLLVDTKVGPTKDDLLMYEYMKYLHLNIIIIGTKADKVGSTLLFKHQKHIIQTLKCDEKKLILTSSESKYGIPSVLEVINHFNINPRIES